MLFPFFLCPQSITATSSESPPPLRSVNTHASLFVPIIPCKLRPSILENPNLMTYYLAAVKPSNQTAFDLACERMKVDAI
ncbi:Ribonuclease P protein subunit p30 [Sesbania bispinosa]|nr:Ribonuclease P protein subunit p30 [Sesbania bispinosa]